MSCYAKYNTSPKVSYLAKFRRKKLGIHLSGADQTSGKLGLQCADSLVHPHEESQRVSE